jgi:hypothetical protein
MHYIALVQENFVYKNFILYTDMHIYDKLSDI